MKLLSTVLIAGLLAGFANAAEQMVNGLRAVVSDSVITERMVRMSATEALVVLARRYADQPEVFEQKRAELMQNAMQGLVERQLVVQDFKGAGFNMPESFLDDAVQAQMKKDFDTRAKMIKTLQAEGLTYEKYRQRIRDQMIIGFLQNKNISSEIIISPHKIEAYYQNHQDQFKLEDQVKLRMIVLDGSAAATPEGRKQLAEEILAKLKEGADFAQMAQVYSTGSQRKEGGDWGMIDRSVLRKELSDVAFALESKQLSKVIETPEFCYIMLVEEKRTAHVKPLSDVRDEIEKTLLVEERARLQKKYVEKLRNKTFIRFF